MGRTCQKRQSSASTCTTHKSQETQSTIHGPVSAKALLFWARHSGHKPQQTSMVLLSMAIPKRLSWNSAILYSGAGLVQPLAWIYRRCGRFFKTLLRFQLPAACRAASSCRRAPAKSLELWLKSSNAISHTAATTTK